MFACSHVSWASASIEPPRRNFSRVAAVNTVELMQSGQSSTGTEKLEAERNLIAAAQRDPSLFGQLYERNFDRVYAFIARRVRSREEAEDLTSEVFHHALNGIARFEWRGLPFVAWLYRIAANAIIDHAKSIAREQQLPAQLEPPVDLSFRDIDAEIERRLSLFRLIDDLPPDQRDVIVARFAEEKSIREIAVAMGRTEGAIKQLQFRAMQTLKTRSSNPPGEANE